MNAIKQLLDALRELVIWWVMIAPWEQGLRVRMGKNVTLLASGVHLKIPIIDRIYRQSVRLRSSTLPAQTLTTADGKPLTVAVTVLYRVANLRLLYDSCHHAEGTICGVVLGAVGEFVASKRSTDCSPRAIVEEMGRLAKLERFGLTDVTVAVNTFAFVRTLRLITGEGTSWTIGDRLDTARAVGEPKEYD